MPDMSDSINIITGVTSGLLAIAGSRDMLRNLKRIREEGLRVRPPPPSSYQNLRSSAKIIKLIVTQPD